MYYTYLYTHIADETLCQELGIAVKKRTKGILWEWDTDNNPQQKSFQITSAIKKMQNVLLAVAR